MNTKATLRYSGSQVASLESLVAQFPRHEFNSPERSTVPSLAFWSTPGPRIAEMCNQLQLAPPVACTLDFEFKVPPREGRGKESHTDVMIWWDDTCIGIEAKHKEPRYQQVGDWLSEGSDRQNRERVLSGWCNLIDQVTGSAIDVSSLTRSTYQMIHRIASVCARAESNKYVIYQVFDATDKVCEYYEKELSSLCRLLRTATAISLYFVRVTIHPSKVYTDLVEAWQTKRTTCSSDVISGLIKGSLMECEISAVQRIE